MKHPNLSLRLLVVAAVVMVFFWCADSLATPITHNQTAVDWENITSLGSPGAANTKETFEFSITNGTGTDWSDYHLRFVNPDGSVFFDPNTVSVADIMLLTDPFKQFQIDANNRSVAGGAEREALITFFGGIVSPGDTFKVRLDLTYSNSVDVFGKPSVVPEPSTLLLVGLGCVLLVGFGVSGRRITTRPLSR